MGVEIRSTGDGATPDWEREAETIRDLGPRHVLFLCVANSARSQMAEGLARSLAGADVEISSAGSSPDRVRPEAIAVMAEAGLDISAHRSKGVGDLDTSSVDVVITLCDDEVCPAYLGAATRIHWRLPDPAAADGDDEARLSAFRDVRDELRRRLERVFDATSPGGSGASGVE